MTNILDFDSSANSGLRNDALVPNSDSVILLFELTSDGHHPGFLQYLVQYWLQIQPSGVLQIVVAPEFFDLYPDIVALAAQAATRTIQFTAVSIDEIAQVQRQTSLISYSWTVWNLFCKYAAQLRATHAVLMFFDSFQIPLALGRTAPCSISGIYFRPTFHYNQFSTHRPSWRDRVRAWRQKLLLAQTLKHPQLKTLFSMDWLAVPTIQAFKRQVKILPLADPITQYTPELQAIEQARSQLGIDPNRRVFLLFGKISGRKGVVQVLEALHNLTPDAAAQICLLIVGCIEPDVKAQMQAQLATLSQHPVQIVVCDRYFEATELQDYLGLAHVVLAPYQQHVGTCATMLHAANAQKPVIVSNYGLMGELARQYELGLVIETREIQQIAQAMMNCLDAKTRAGNPEKMRDFARQNLWTTFAETIFREVLS